MQAADAAMPTGHQPSGSIPAPTCTPTSTPSATADSSARRVGRRRFWRSST